MLFITRLSNSLESHWSCSLTFSHIYINFKSCPNIILHLLILVTRTYPKLFLKFHCNQPSYYLAILMTFYTSMVINISLYLKFINSFLMWTPYSQWTTIDHAFYLFSSTLVFDNPRIIPLCYTILDHSIFKLFYLYKI